MYSADCIGIDKIMKEWIRNDNVSVEEEKSSFEIIIFPNPSENQLTIKSNDELLISFELIDISGKIIFSKVNIFAHEYKLLSNDCYLKSGFYNAKIKSKNSTKTIPIIVEK